MSTATLAWNGGTAAAKTDSDPGSLSPKPTSDAEPSFMVGPSYDAMDVIPEGDGSTACTNESKPELAAQYQQQQQQQQQHCWKIPAHHGLLLQLHSNDGNVTLHAVPDQHFPDIHPHCYAPASLQNVRLLHGGGSGTAVFGGYDPVMAQQHIVMKHGGSKDTGEVMSLATIRDQLLLRRQRGDAAEPAAAAERMKARIPEFMFVYISRHHLRDRAQELWNSLRTITYTHSGRRLSLIASANKHHRISLGGTSTNRPLSQSDLGAVGEEEQQRQKQARSQSVCEHYPIQQDQDGQDLMKVDPRERELHVITGRKASENQFHVVTHGPVELRIPHCDPQQDYCIDTGVAFMQEFQTELMQQQDKHNWKVTLAQKWIGGPNADNGADVLTSGRLMGKLLDKLMREFTSIMQDLDALTLPEERHGVLERVKNEVDRLQELDDVRAVSKEADSFVGKAILKNFHPGHGRFRNLRLLGDDFRDGDFFLTEGERPPAEFLARLLQPGAIMSDIFVDTPDSQSALDRMEDRGWLDILQHAVQLEDCPSATECIWTCGLTDAGLHNTFLSTDRGLEVFDLGGPTLEPRPAFLTKFLMSFFHTLGMEHDGGSSWKTRFVVVEGNDDGLKRLALTQETQLKVPYIHDVFHTALEHFIQNIFNGNGSVRQLLIKYVVLQLLSDAAFCLRRWEAKGGGAKRYGECLKYQMEKWLWRSVWDQYIACYVHVNFLKE